MKQFYFYEFILKLKQKQPQTAAELFNLFCKKYPKINLSKRHFINYLDFFQREDKLKILFANRKGTNKQLIKHYKKTSKL